MSITFRYARVDEYERVATFLGRYWADQHIYVRDRRLFDWTFHAHGWFVDDDWASADGSRYTFVIAEENAEIVGALGGIPFRLNSLGDDLRAVWIVNYVIRPDHRKGPAALQLINTFRRPPFSAVIAAGLDPATTLIYRVLRGHVLPAMPRYIAVLSGATKRMAHLIEIAHEDWPSEKAVQLAQHFELPSLTEAKVSAEHTIPDDWDSSQWSAISRHTVGAARDCRYLTWRYLNHPTFRYQVITVPEGARTGLAIWRLESIYIQSASGREEIDKIGRVVEFLPCSQTNAEQLASSLVWHAAEQNALGLDFYCYHGAYGKWLENAGFKAANSHPDGVAIPARFRPLDAHDGSIHCAMFAADNLPPCTGVADCPWYWTKSDSDQDRPN